MKFSIITVCWNSEKVLPRAMASLFTQRYKDYEWVVIDGASTDGTLGIVQSFSSAPLVLVSEADGGIYDAMNKGVAKARGDYVFFLNSDDAFHDENVLEDISVWLEQNPLIDFLYGSVVNTKANGDWLRDFGHVARHNIIEEGICHQAIFAKRVLFNTIGAFDVRFRLNADYDWIIRAFRCGAHCAYINRRIAFFSDGGAHSLDKNYLAKERETVRLQYIGKRQLTIRLLRARIYNRLHRIAYGYMPGALRINEGHLE
ncbi:MAG: glycosyltransferase family 2 protein [Nitrosospira sp.]